MTELICPVCGGALERNERTYRCPSGHSFDRARSGYVNLLPPAPGGKRRGDDKLMVRARTAFLDKGYYDRLAELLADCADRYAPRDACVVDAGCGEGMYTARVLERLAQSGKRPEVVGLDISKEALIRAAKRSGELTLCAASTAHMPLPDGCADLVLNIFSPFMGGEFARVLKPGGKLIRAVPLERHLWGLKKLIYDTPYENPPTDLEEPGFHMVEQRELRYQITLDKNEDIMNLFQMTPYYYKTGAADQEKAARAQCLTTAVEFGVCVYEKSTAL